MLRPRPGLASHCNLRAKEDGCDGVARHRGLTAMVLGSETLKVLTHSKLPVLVYR